MNEKHNDMKDQILEHALKHVPFDGWTKQALNRAVADLGHKEDIIKALFPDGIRDVLAHFSSMQDGKMLEVLASKNPDDMRIRDRIHTAVMTRFRIMEADREAERLALRYWSRPDRHLQGARLVWKTADKIWIWAGDTSEDYNHYTKRTLLSGVIGSTTLAWLNDESVDLKETEEFLGRRIKNVMKLGAIIGKLKGVKRANP